MLYVWIGSFCFILFALSDWNKIYLHSRLLQYSFFAGFLLLSFATGMIVIKESNVIIFSFSTTILCSFLAMLSFILLIYSLFFALPFSATYLEHHEKTILNDRGFYALCRHPGVLFFMAFYLFSGLAVGNWILLLAGFVFSILNVIYIWIQDRWFFPVLYQNFTRYQQNTPFLIPNRNSMHRCVKTMRRPRENRNEI